MQRTLNYITAELNMRTAEDAALKGKEGDGLIKKMDSGQRMRKMEDQDSRWEKEFGGNPRWGEGRREWNYGK
ncbi:hypothetical protein EJ02DRAFT_459067 [Clathrospora elynae]|uniref:Uncharacterized protein n=1 Tax=Clathrospora elynae TaxID=706981 RepID=A0A6A5S8J3_9PLEO|nr:hypothetical protein EJ02DRAFT_459067 [Clathrospora elynae]